MSSEREEIRWQFQIMLDNITSEIDQANTNMKVKSEHSERTIDTIERRRNGFLAAVAFGVTILITLVIAQVFPESYWKTIVLVGIVGLVVYYAFEWLLKKQRDLTLAFKVLHLDAIDGKLRPLKGMIATLALDKEITVDDLEIIKNYAVVYTRAIDFDLTMSVFKTAGGNKMGTLTLYGVTIGMNEFPYDSYQKYYENAKKNLESFKNSNLSLGIVGIEKFIKDFESNEKEMQN